MDPNSFANNDEIAITHLHLKLKTDFDQKVLVGCVEITARAIKDQVDQIVLDSSYLDIQRISCEDHPLKYTVNERHPIYGSKIVIDLLQKLDKDQVVKLIINYSTTDKCTAVQWLNPEQTVGKKEPYLFTQCQAIHARSLVPCQDTPSVKITYSAEITVPGSLRALMSAIQVSETRESQFNIYKFEQKIAIPSYLIALAVGNLVGIKVGPRSTVWSEPQVVEAAAWEFKDTEEFIKVGESILTPYVWGVYDLLLLPASFPYGGMENPCLTFVTPTLLAGDRSLVDVVAHEITHSWMGNLVTTQNWEHFWLNEGFTVFVERKIAERLYGREMLEFDAIIGLKALQESVDHFEEINRPEFSVLCPSLKDNDPDDAFSSIPYEKGFNLLYYLEKLIGPAVFAPYLKSHVEHFSHKSITTTDFKDYIFEYFNDSNISNLLSAVDWEGWFTKPGMPIIHNEFDDSLAKPCILLAQEWDSCRTTISYPTRISDFSELSSNQKIMFLEKMLQKQVFPIHVLEALDSLYSLSSISNAEIKFRWQWLCLNGNYEPIFPLVVTFISSVGRMKFVRPLYRALFKSKSGKTLATSTFLKNKGFYHPICAAMISKDLGIKMDLLHKLLKEEAERGATSINLSDRNLLSIPNEVFLLKTLERIGLANNNLTIIPKDFSSLGNLKYVNLKSNLLSEIPNCICTLPYLDILDISRNKLSRLPERPGFLINVRILNISRNKITTLPLWIGNMTNLTLFQIHKNPIEWPTNDIIEMKEGEDEEEWLVGLKNYLKNHSEKDIKTPNPVKAPNSTPATVLSNFESEDQIQNLLDIIRDALDVPWNDNLKIPLKLWLSSNKFLSVIDTFLRSFRVHSKLENGLSQQELFKDLHDSSLFLAYCIMGLNASELTRKSLDVCVKDLNSLLTNLSTPKPRAARFQILGLYAMSSDLGLALKDLKSPKSNLQERSLTVSQVLSRGKSLLFSFSDIQNPSLNVLNLEKCLDSLAKTHDFASLSEILIALVKEIDPKENRELLKQTYDVILVVQCLL